MSRSACLSMVLVLTLGAMGCSTTQQTSPKAEAGAKVQTAPQVNAETTEKPTEVELLKHQLAMASGRQMQAIVGAAYKYARAHDGSFPTKPSDLKEALGDEGWRYFIAPYESNEMDTKIKQNFDHWANLDEQCSYEFTGVKLDETNMGRQVVVKERRSIWNNKRWYFFDDGHGQLTDEAGLKDWQKDWETAYHR